MEDKIIVENLKDLRKGFLITGNKETFTVPQFVECIDSCFSHNPLKVKSK